MRAATFFTACCLFVSIASAEEAREMRWRFRVGDRFDVTMNSTQTSNVTDRERRERTRLEVELDATITITEVESSGDGVGTLRFRTLRATAERDGRTEQINLSGREVPADLRVEISTLGVLTLTTEQFEDSERRVGLERAFEGLFFRLPERPVTRNEEFRTDRGSIRLRMTYEGIRREGRDEIAAFRGQVEERSDANPRSSGRGTTTMEFNLTQGYMRLLDEDASFTATQGDQRAEGTLTRRIRIVKTSAR